MKHKVKMAIIGVPSCAGARVEGVEHAPDVLRRTGLIETLRNLVPTLVDMGDLKVPAWNPNVSRNSKLKNLDAVVQVSRALSEKVSEACKEGFFPLILGGDCTILIGSLLGLRALSTEIGLIYFDAHGDFNTPETSPSGYIEGMGLAVAVGRGAPELTSLGGSYPIIREKNVVLFGVRDLDEQERRALKKSEIIVYSHQKIQEMTVNKAIREAIEAIKKNTIFFHLDVDVVSPKEMPAVDVPAANGLAHGEVVEAIRAISQSGRLIGMEVAAFNPTKDQQVAAKVAELVVAAFQHEI